MTRILACLILTITSGCAVRHTQPDGSVTEIDTRGGGSTSAPVTKDDPRSLRISVASYALLLHADNTEAARVACVDAARELALRKRSQVDSINDVLRNAAKAEGELQK